MTEETGWRQKLEALRERPKPLVLQPKKSQLVPYGTPPSPVSKSCIQTPNRCERTAACNNPSRHGRRIQASPDGSAETTGDPRRQPNLGHPAFDPPDAHLKIVNVADRKDCSGHPLAVLNAANQKESLRHVTSSGSYVLDGGPDAVPECLNTFSDFYNPSVSADERFEKYLAEMHRREREVEATERLKVRNSSIGNFHYSKYSKKRRPFPLNGKKIPLHSGITQSLGNDLGAPDSDRNLSGLPRSKKPLAISTFSLLDIDKMRHKDGLGVPHTTR